MKIPRGLSASQLIKLVEKFGFNVSRQSGSHTRLPSNLMGEHHMTIPNHSPLKLGMLNVILNDVAAYSGKDKTQLISELF